MRNKRLVYIAVAVAVAVATVAGCKHDAQRSPREPGVRLVYSIDLDRAVDDRAAGGTAIDADAVRAAALKQAVEVIRDRIDNRGVTEARVASQGDQIVVELPGLDDEATAALRSLITRTAALSFHVVDHDSALMRRLFARVGDEAPARDADAAALGITAHVDQWQLDPRSIAVDYYLTAADRDEVLTVGEARAIGCVHGGQASGSIRCLVSGRRVLERYLAALAVIDPVLAVPADRGIGYERVEVEGQRPTWRTYYLVRAARLTGADLAAAELTYDPTTRRPQILVTFDRAGARELGTLTAESVGKKLAIVLDDVIRSAPIVQSTITGGHLVITLGGDDRDREAREAQELVDVLRSGSLPAPLMEERLDRLPAP